MRVYKWLSKASKRALKPAFYGALALFGLVIVPGVAGFYTFTGLQMLGLGEVPSVIASLFMVVFMMIFVIVVLTDYDNPF